MSHKRKIIEKRYSVHGDGDNVIVLIHGFLSSSKYWNKVRPGLVNAGYKVVSIDLLGFGRADKPDHIEYGYSDQIAYIKQIISDIGLSHPYHIAGHSMGAAIAAKYAKSHANDLESLILLHPPMYLNSAQAYHTLMQTSKLYRFLLSSKYRAFGWKLLRYTLPHHISAHTAQSREMSLNNIVIKAELISDLQDIATKTLLLVGLKDRSVYLDNLLNIASNPLLRVIKEDVDHHSPVKYPRLIQSHILDFMSNT